MDDREFRIRLAASKMCRKYDPFKPWGMEMFGRTIKVRIQHYVKNVRDMIHFYRDMYGKGHQR